MVPSQILDCCWYTMVHDSIKEQSFFRSPTFVNSSDRSHKSPLPTTVKPPSTELLIWHNHIVDTGKNFFNERVQVAPTKHLKSVNGDNLDSNCCINIYPTLLSPFCWIFWPLILLKRTWSSCRIFLVLIVCRCCYVSLWQDFAHK